MASCHRGRSSTTCLIANSRILTAYQLHAYRGRKWCAGDHVRMSRERALNTGWEIWPRRLRRAADAWNQPLTAKVAYRFRLHAHERRVARMATFPIWIITARVVATHQ